MAPPGGTGQDTGAHGPLHAAEAMAADPAQQAGVTEGAWRHGTARHSHVRPQSDVLGEGSVLAPAGTQHSNMHTVFAPSAAAPRDVLPAESTPSP